MPVLQFTGMPGAGKTTLANRLVVLLHERNIDAVVIDGDVYRKTISKDLGFSIADRMENIRRLGMEAYRLSQEGRLVIIAAINPMEASRRELKNLYGAKLVWLRCSIETLQQRDTKGLYKRAMLADDHPMKIHNLSGINDPFEEPASPDLVIDTGESSIPNCSDTLFDFTLSLLKNI